MIIRKNFLLLNYNTFHLPVTAREMITLEKKEDYLNVFHHTSVPDEDYIILGDGSNVLFTSDYDGLILNSNDHTFTIEKENESHAIIRAGAGLNWHDFVMRTIELGYQGLENLSLIPGRVGAAPVQNIGAYGVECDKFILSVEALDLHEKNIVNIPAAECEFGYRRSLFKSKHRDRFLIRSVQFKLNKIPDYNTDYHNLKETLDAMNVDLINAKTISEAVISIRKSKLPDPDHLGNAGSFFKNPVIDRVDFEGLMAEFSGIKGYQISYDQIKIPAAWLIEQCGWKGKRMGDAGVHDRQALVLINYGNASGKEIFDLSMQIMDSVREKFGIMLEHEVRIV